MQNKQRICGIKENKPFNDSDTVSCGGPTKLSLCLTPVLKINILY